MARRITRRPFTTSDVGHASSCVSRRITRRPFTTSDVDHAFVLCPTSRR